MQNDPMGDRIKGNYEDRTRISLPRRTYSIIRLDGKAFHSYCRDFKRPYDENLVKWMDFTAIQLCKNIQGAKFAYAQSDEISILLTDFESEKTDAWFDGNIQKICSVSASMATAYFNEVRLSDLSEGKTDQTKFALFDARVFSIPDPTEVANYFVWRQRDAVRNSISMLAQSLYSHKQLEGKNSSDKQEMCFQKGFNWNDVSVRNKRGGFYIKTKYLHEDGGERSVWEATECPHFTVEELSKYIPLHKPYQNEE